MQELASPPELAQRRFGRCLPSKQERPHSEEDVGQLTSNTTAEQREHPADKDSR